MMLVSLVPPPLLPPCSNMYKILGEDKVMVDKLAPERLEAEYSLVRIEGSARHTVCPG